MLERTYLLKTPTNMCHIKTGGKLSCQQIITLNFTAKQPTCSDNVSIIKCKTLVKCIHMMQRVSEGRPYLQTASSVHYFPEGTQHSFVVNRKQMGRSWGGGAVKSIHRAKVYRCRFWHLVHLNNRASVAGKPDNSGS